MKKLILGLVFLPFAVFAQNDLLQELEGLSPTKQYTVATFKGSRLVNGHTVETRGKGELELIFQHRFGLLNGGLYELFGLDQAYVRLGMDYGVSDRLSIGLGRNSVDKTMDSYIKYKVLRQATGSTSSPVTLTILGGLAYKTSPRKKEDPNFLATNRMAYVGQLLISRKLTSSFSVQVMPTIIHKNAVEKSVQNNSEVALGFGGRLKVSRSIALTSEFYPRLNAIDNTALAANGLVKNFNSVGFGIDIETGGHVFQLIISNTNNLTERAFITETSGSVNEGELHLGFNITRGFQIGKKKR